MLRRNMQGRKLRHVSEENTYIRSLTCDDKTRLDGGLRTDGGRAPANAGRLGPLAADFVPLVFSLVGRRAEDSYRGKTD